MPIQPLLAVAFLVGSLASCSRAPGHAKIGLVEKLGTPAAKAKVYERTLLSRRYHIDKKYRSMKGPDSIDSLSLSKSKIPELLWIVGYKAVVVDGKGKGAVSQEFMCHSNLDFDASTYFKNFKSDASMSGRLFTLSQGQQDIHFPDGYGIPMMSDEKLSLATQVLNLNLDKPNMHVRHKVTIRYVRDRELGNGYKPLFQAAVQGFKSLSSKKAHYGVDKSQSSVEKHGAGCSVGLSAVSGDVDKDGHGQRFTGHWVVKPGREENRTLVTKFLQLQFDTKIHYIATHLHPFSESLELIDRTTGKRVFKSLVEPAKNKIGIKRISYFSSKEGIPIYKDHEYELVSVYNNTSKENQDSMAVMYLYLNDIHFKKPKLAKN